MTVTKVAIGTYVTTTLIFTVIQGNDKKDLIFALARFLKAVRRQLHKTI